MVCSPRGSTSYDASQVSESDLVKLAIRLTPDSSGLMEHAWADEETLWGRPLGNDLFEIRNIPWETDTLHFLDVVRCRIRSDDFWDVLELIRPSGHGTLRLTFADSASADQREAVLTQLEQLLGNIERMRDGHWTVDVNPSADLDTVLAVLAQQEQAGVIVQSAHT